MTQDKGLKEQIARQIWMDNTGSDTGWITSHSFVKKTGACYAVADQIIALARPIIWDMAHAIGFRDGVIKEKKRIIGVINGLNSIGYPYGANYKVAILQALKEGK